MDDKNHLWCNAIPRQIKQGGDTLFLRQCELCGRDFAQRLGGWNWRAVSIGVQQRGLRGSCHL
jgi:hypothetical protein